MNLNSEQSKGIFSGVFFGYFVLVLHLLLIIGLAVTVVLLKGIYDFWWLILFGGLLLIGGSGYLLWQRLKASNRTISDLLNNPALHDRTLEVSLLGGLASVKIGHRDDSLKLIQPDTGSQQLLSPPQTSHAEEIGRLTRLLDEKLITREEFQQLKQELLAPPPARH